jgi:hypothetical protein
MNPKFKRVRSTVGCEKGAPLTNKKLFRSILIVDSSRLSSHSLSGQEPFYFFDEEGQKKVESYKSSRESHRKKSTQVDSSRQSTRVDSSRQQSRLSLKVEAREVSDV